ncbi:transporter substrate-binding domain-containing protein [Nocardiopsis sp. NPDC006938]|uniref:transporter substrate-binding domain-containing protein n=1 Tax=Nocardiopsis sp. NPDC006938 TaxID=3364337 RepID=UPI00368AF64A
MWTRGGRGRTVAALGAVAVLALPACSAEGGAEAPVESLLDKTSVTIGVKADQPGVGIGGDGVYEGFDVDVANYIVEELELPNVEFVSITSNEREARLGGDPDLPPGTPVKDPVDMVVATYSVTPARSTLVTFAGPYYVAKQDILVRKDDPRVKGVADLAGLEICQGEGSNSADRVVTELGIDANVLDVPDSYTYSDCVQLLKEGEIDAVTTDDLILAGFLDEDPEAFQFVNSPFTEERYGVGLPHGDVAGCEAVNRAIDKMFQSGEAERSLVRWFGETDLDLVMSVPQFEGCG